MPERTVKLTYAEAVNAALRRSLEEIPETLVYGEDVGKPGGVFGVTKGLLKEFGSRVFDTPISEAAILGSAVGAAIMGRRPIVEVMWVDFSLVALDQLVNQAANVRYVSQGRLQAPMVVRTQQGSMPGACAQHSQSLEALFAHIPGLLVGLPATAQDAYDLLLSAVHADDPTIVIENRNLYFGQKEEVVVEGPVQPVGGATIRRPGTQVTVVTWGAILHRVVAAAERLAGNGVSAEVIDARWLVPFDDNTVFDSVDRTGRLVVVHEANRTGGFGAEVTARVAEAGFLTVPPLRIAVPDCRIPAAPNLLGALVPDEERIAEEIKTFVQRDT